MKQAVTNFKKYIRIYTLFFKQSISLIASHRFNLIMSAVSNILWTAGQVISLQYLFEKVSTFDGWSFSDMLFLLGFGQLYVYTMFITYQSNHDHVEKKIIRGELDRILTRPINLKFFLSFESVSILQIIPCFVTVLPLLTLGFLGLKEVGVTDIIFATITFIVGAIIMFFFSLILAGINFYTDSAQSLRDMFASSTDMSRVPITFYPTGLQLIFIFVMPFAFVTFYPAAILKNIQGVGFVISIEILVLIAMILISKIVWAKGLKRYTGAA
jgi:ABC-2 type transport system permease protein